MKSVPRVTLTYNRSGHGRRSGDLAGVLLATLLCLDTALARAEVPAEPPLFHTMFQDHEGLQRDQPILFWGRAQPGQEVSIALGEARGHARVDGEGRWEAQLSPLQAGGPHVLTARAGSRIQTITDVLVGDVWLCSGQSNMELQVWRSLDANSEK